MIKICPICGAVFETKYSGRIYCSKKCCNKANRPKKHLQIKFCAYCGKEFETSNHLKIFCSDRCQQQNHFRKTAPKKDVTPLPEDYIFAESIVPDEKLFVHLKAVDEEYTFKTLRQAVNFLSVFTKYDTVECIELLRQHTNKIDNYKIFYD